MAEYIDRVSLMKLLCSDNCGNNGEEECACEEVCYFAGLIADIPTADVAPVVHGRWVERKTNVGSPNTDWFCNKCDFPSWNMKTKYCPNCGSKMDGGTE